MPRADDIMDSLHCTLDLMCGHWQIEMEESSKHKTAFGTHNGTFEFNFMPFGLCNAPATFQRTMDYVIHDIKEKSRELLSLP